MIHCCLPYIAADIDGIQKGIFPPNNEKLKVGLVTFSLNDCSHLPYFHSHLKIKKECYIFFFLWRCDPALVMAYSFLRFSRAHTTTHHSRQDSSGRVISSSQRPLPDNTQHSQQTNIHAPGGIRTHDLSRRAAEDLRLRPLGHWNRQCYIYIYIYIYLFIYLFIYLACS